MAFGVVTLCWVSQLRYRAWSNRYLCHVGLFVTEDTAWKQVFPACLLFRGKPKYFHFTEFFWSAPIFSGTSLKLLLPETGRSMKQEWVLQEILTALYSPSSSLHFLSCTAVDTSLPDLIRVAQRNSLLRKRKLFWCCGGGSSSFPSSWKGPVCWSGSDSVSSLNNCCSRRAPPGPYCSSWAFTSSGETWANPRTKLANLEKIKQIRTHQKTLCARAAVSNRGPLH